MRLVILCLFIPSTVFSQHISNRDLKKGKFKNDSSHIYILPFENKKKVFVVQDYETIFSHKGIKALDFKIKKGTRVCAARAGLVIAARGDSNKRGLKIENLNDWNYIFIQHNDGSVGIYGHFKKDGVLVNMGDTIQAGQLIGLSGNTGFSAFPHLHFEVQGYDADGNYTTLPTRFYTQKGIIYLRAGQFYRTFHE